MPAAVTRSQGAVELQAAAAQVVAAWFCSICDFQVVEAVVAAALQPAHRRHC